MRLPVWRIRQQAWIAMICLVLCACSRVNPIPDGTVTPLLSPTVSPFATLTPVLQMPSPVQIATATALLSSETSAPASTLTLSPTSAPATPSETPTLAVPASLVPISSENAAALAQIFEMRFNWWELVTAVAWSPDGKVLAASVGENILLYSAQDWTQLASVDLAAFTPSLAFSPDGEWLAAGSRDGRLRVWRLVMDPAQKKVDLQQSLMLYAHKQGVNSIAFSPDGRLLASGGNDAVARFWDAFTGETRGSTVGGTFVVPSIAFAPDGISAAVANGKQVRLREIETGRILGTFQAEAPLYYVAFSPDGHILAAADTDNQVLLWDSTQAFRAANPQYPEAVRLLGHTGKPGNFRALVWQIAFSPDGRLLASAGGDATVRLWDIAAVEGKQLLTTLVGHTGGVTCVAFHPEGRALASGGLDSTLRVWAVVKP